MRFRYIFAIFALLFIGLFVFLGNSFFGFTPNNNPPELFVVQKGDSFNQVVTSLRKKGYLSERASLFTVAQVVEGLFTVDPGGYYLKKNMAPWQLIYILKGEPTFVWVTLIPGRRKEEVGENLSKAFGWNAATLQEWNNLKIDPDGNYYEGQLYPDTYLLPRTETPAQIAERIRAHFNDVIAPLLPEFDKQNIKWTTGLKIASLIQREASGTQDMPLIAGILWNRLQVGQKLQIDATVIYARGNIGEGWWAPASPADLQNIDSPYNTYKVVGLPPTPIASPGLPAIKAVLFPEDTKCLYYLHDRQRQIHCAVTYKEHLENIKTYFGS